MQRGWLFPHSLSSSSVTNTLPVVQIEHLFDAGMWVWFIVRLAREILDRICLEDLWKAKDADQFVADFLASDNSDMASSAPPSRSASPSPVRPFVRASARINPDGLLSTPSSQSASATLVVPLARASPRLVKPRESLSSARASATKTTTVVQRAAPARSQRKPVKRQKRQRAFEGHHAMFSEENIGKM